MADHAHLGAETAFVVKKNYFYLNSKPVSWAENRLALPMKVTPANDQNAQYALTVRLRFVGVPVIAVFCIGGSVMHVKFALPLEQ